MAIGTILQHHYEWKHCIWLVGRNLNVHPSPYSFSGPIFQKQFLRVFANFTLLSLESQREIFLCLYLFSRQNSQFTFVHRWDNSSSRQSPTHSPIQQNLTKYNNWSFKQNVTVVCGVWILKCPRHQTLGEFKYNCDDLKVGLSHNVLVNAQKRQFFKTLLKPRS